MSNTLKKEELTRSLPNTLWLRKLLRFQIEIWQDIVNIVECQKDDPEFIQECRIDLEIFTQVLEQCTKSKKDVILTKEQWDGMDRILDILFIDGNYFDTEYWETNKERFFDVSMRLKNWHSMDKYIELFKVGKIDSEKQWRKCVDGICDCSAEEMIEYPSVITPPTISEEEWNKCAETGIIDFNPEFLCPICNKFTAENNHGDHKVYPTMECLGCYEGVEPYHMLWSISLNAEQKKNLVYSLRYYIYGYEEDTEDEFDEQSKIRKKLELKILKNARHNLKSSTSGRILFDSYSLSPVRQVCHNFIKTEENMMKDSSIDDMVKESSPSNVKELGKIIDNLSEIREIIDLSPRMEKPLCYQCVNNRAERGLK